MISVLKNKLSKKGFTLAELLVVVAIIAILVAVAIPVFGNALNNSKVQTDAANLRSAKAVAVTNYMLVQAGETGVTLTDGYVFDPATSAFVAPASKTDAMKGKSTANASRYIVLDIGADGTPTVSWDTVS